MKQAGTMMMNWRGRMILLPGTGFFLGIFTNWWLGFAAFKMGCLRNRWVAGWFVGCLVALLVL